MSCIGGVVSVSVAKIREATSALAEKVVESFQPHNIDSPRQLYAKDMPKNGKDNNSARARTGDRLCVRQK